MQLYQLRGIISRCIVLQRPECHIVYLIGKAHKHIYLKLNALNLIYLLAALVSLSQQIAVYSFSAVKSARFHRKIILCISKIRA